MTNQNDWTEEYVRWMKSYIEDFNERCKKAGFPQFIIDKDVLYKDELHRLLGIGIKLQPEE